MHSHSRRIYRRRQLRVGLSDEARNCRWCLALLLFLGLAVALSYVWLRRSHQEMAGHLQTLRRESAARAKEAENLRAELESFRCGQYILTAVERLKLSLHPPLPGQVRRVSVAPRSQPDHRWPADGLLAKQ